MEKIFLKDEQDNLCVPKASADALCAEFEYYDVPTDGVTDASSALQDVIDNSEGVLYFPTGTYVLGSSLNVDTSKVKSIIGNGAILKVTGDFPALIITGNPTSSTWTADQNSLNTMQITHDASTIISGLKITSNDFSYGIGIVLNNTWTAIVKNCYIWNINVGIEVRGRNRNPIIEGNNIYKIKSYGIYYSQDSNVHQSNIYGNHISYCQICIYFKQTAQTANVQIVGNDIEIASWPTTDSTSTRCIVIDYQQTQDTIFSEIEISGNTIQGHELSNGLIDIMSANSSAPIENVSIGSNQISNTLTGGYGIKFKNCHNVALCNNTYRRVKGPVYALVGTIDCFVASGEVTGMGSSFVSTDSDAVLNAVSFVGLTGKSLTSGINIDCSSVNRLSITGCNITGNVTVTADTIDYVNVSGNINNGSYAIASCSHRIVDNNI